MRSNHEGCKEAIEELRDMLNIIHPDDLMSGKRMQRKFKPPPYMQQESLLKWIGKWTIDGYDVLSNKHMFTDNTYRALSGVFDMIKRWMISDPLVPQPRGSPLSHLPVQLYQEKLTDEDDEDEDDKDYFSMKSSMQRSRSLQTPLARVTPLMS